MMDENFFGFEENPDDMPNKTEKPDTETDPADTLKEPEDTSNKTKPKKDYLKGIKEVVGKTLSKVKNNSDNKELLIKAYEMLQISYPTSMEEIRDAYYNALFKNDSDDGYEKKVKKARALIENNISIDPTTENIKLKNPRIKFGDVIKIKTPLFKKQSTLSDIISEKKGHKKKKKKHLKRKILLILLILGIPIAVKVYSLNNSKVTKTNLHSAAQGDQISLNTSVDISLALLARDGITFNNDTVAVDEYNTQKITTSEIKLLPLLNYYIIKREVVVSGDILTTKYYTLSLYKDREIADNLSDWVRVWERTDADIIDADLSGNYYGECTLIGKYGLDNVSVRLDVKESGYTVGVMTFTIDGNEASVNLEGRINLKDQTIILNENGWNKRPYLLISPKLKGKVDVVNERFISDKSSTQFELKRVLSGTELIRRKITQAVKRGYADKKVIEAGEEKIYQIPLNNLTDIEIINEDFKKDEGTAVITGKIKNNVCIHSIVGTVKYEVDNNIFNVICLCSVTDSRVNLEGTYKGKETSMGKTWNTIYTITGSSDDYYIAEVKLQSGFNVITEERVLEVTDDNSVIVSRQDVLSGDILSFEPFITSIDYTEDALVGTLNLQR